MKLALLLSYVLICFTTISCAPITKVSGYVPLQKELQQLRVGVSKKQEIIDILGEPLNYNGDSVDSLIYIQQKVEAKAFLRPRVRERTIIKLSFNDAKILSNIEKSTEVDTKPLTIDNEIVVSEGRKLTFFQQMFGNIGNFSSEQFFD